MVGKKSDGGSSPYKSSRSIYIKVAPFDIHCVNRVGAGTRFGWFASYANTDVGRIAVVYFCRAGRQPLAPKQRRLRDGCTVIITTTSSSWPTPLATTATAKPMNTGQ